MALKIRLRPGERLAVNGAVLRNGGQRAVELEVLNQANLMHERDIMLPEQADTPLRTLYLLIQLMHLEPDGHQANYNAFIQRGAEIYARAFQASDSQTCELVQSLIGHVGQRDCFAALKLLQKAIGRPPGQRQAAETDRA